MYNKGSCWNRQVSKSVSGSFVKTQLSAAAGGTVETQTKKFDNLEISREKVPLNCSNKATQEKWLQMVTASLCY